MMGKKKDFIEEISTLDESKLMILLQSNESRIISFLFVSSYNASFISFPRRYETIIHSAAIRKLGNQNGNIKISHFDPMTNYY